MIKQEAFNYLKGKKVYTAGKGPEIIEKAEKAGFQVGEHIDKRKERYPFLLFTDDREVHSCYCMDDFISNDNDEITAEEILELNIVDFGPFDKVLVRDSDNCIWKPKFFGRIINNYADGTAIFVDIDNASWAQCIPYEGNENKAYQT